MQGAKETRGNLHEQPLKRHVGVEFVGQWESRAPGNR